ncbi:hypothetical protein COEREDRAFT_83197 [Coemansia reversa NRRL 1564]|uniref:Peptidase S1 domain-containing protein n=1 Tax=Coemansia reversa (strain ATCC 12441 / NRRL 1564) TaxID=763665 RepID=A0A2G5B494_COERN|nr:hypothetical protein COEREDRAFT_83197 [Coemansia reversa NRRL 1564]|eukprot:PIA13828.1 hypothetical protein COEREDRAFT_83197 [Coemansia reversa NRRL 1564]
MAFLSSQVALITADCFDFIGKNVDRSSNYQVYTSRAFTKTTEGFDLRDIIVHPDYNPVTKANNVAVASYNLKRKLSWEMDTAIDLDTWQARVYAQRHIKNMTGLIWDYPEYTTEDTVTQDDTCSDLSPIYKANTDKFTCTPILADPLMKNSTSCKIPYPVLYVQMGEDLYQAGIFSHSVVKGGDNLCNNQEVRSYYTLIGDYLAFAEKALDKKFTYHSNDNSSTPQSDPDYSMKDASTGVNDGTLMLSGDFYNPKAVVIGSAVPSEDASMATETNENATNNELASDESNKHGSDETNELGLDASNEQATESDSKSTSKKTIIIAAVCGSIGTLLLVAGILFGIRWYRGHVSKVHDPYQAPSAQDFLEEMFENSNDGRPPPAYKPPSEAHARQGQSPIASNASFLDSRYSGLNFPNDKS